MKRRRRLLYGFRTKLLTAAAISLLCAILALSVIVSRQYTAELWKEKEQNTLAAFSVVGGRMSALLEGAKRIALATQQDSSIDAYIWNAYDTDLARVQGRQKVLQTLSAPVSQQGSLYGLLFLKGDGTLYGSMIPWTFFYETERHPFSREQALVDAIERRASMWIGPYHLSDFTLNTRANVDDPLLVCGVMQNRYALSTETGAQTLTTLVVVSAQSLRETFAYLCGDRETIYLLNDEGTLITSAAEEEQRDPAGIWSVIDPLVDEGGARTRDALTGEKRYVIYARIPYTGWYFVKSVPLDAYEGQLTALQRAVFLTALLLLVVIGTVYALWIGRFTRSIRPIGEALDRMRAGNLRSRVEQELPVREFEEMRVQYNRMADSIEGLIERTQRMEREAAALEMRNLQAQLSPHMIFNSITAIRWMATLSGAEPVSEMLIALAEMLRPVFREWRLDWKLREEIDYMAHYTRLLRLRYGSMLQIEMDIAEELMDIRLPRFTFQPILENSCEHGRAGAGPLTVRLAAHKDTAAGIIVITIRDNGPGIEPERLARIRERLAGAPLEEGAPAPMGLYNVHRRIQLFCGPTYGLTVESSQQEGTLVTILLSAPDFFTSQ